MMEFHAHEKNIQRIHTLFMVTKVIDHIPKAFFNDRLFQYVIKLAEDQVPNIKFNFSKTIE